MPPKSKYEFNTKSFLEHYRIVYTTEHHHCTEGFYQIHCPFPSCRGKNNFHLGIHQKYGFGVCWRCGKHTLNDLIAVLVKPKNSDDLWEIKKQFYSKNIAVEPIIKRSKRTATIVKYPIDTHPLEDRHKRYLSQRGYDPEELEKEWELKGTGPVGDFSHRIITPINYRGRMVSYYGRDITGKAKLRWRPCDPVNEVISHKDLLYGWDKVSERALVVEGPSDVWRMGPGAVCTFGVKYTPAQVGLLSKLKIVYILFDNEPMAQAQAAKLANELSYITKVYLLDDIEYDDPGSMDYALAHSIMRELGFRGAA